MKKFFSMFLCIAILVCFSGVAFAGDVDEIRRIPVLEASAPQPRATICGNCDRGYIFTVTLHTYEESLGTVKCNEYNRGTDDKFGTYVLRQQQCNTCGFKGAAWSTIVSERRECHGY